MSDSELDRIIALTRAKKTKNSNKNHIFFIALGILVFALVISKNLIFLLLIVLLLFIFGIRESIEWMG
ncbi:hypothetical protein [Coleofasciculus sp. H7-2]|uniref:hypothetical protein n=1 Tax=Coleofasciculus sp. H7-2 TaxID=3351545 RepID=UPI0036701A1C